MTIGYFYMSLPVNHLLPINAGTLKQTCSDRNRLACHETRFNGTSEREREREREKERETAEYSLLIILHNIIP